MVRNHHSIGNAGEFYVLAQLAQRGYIAGKTDPPYPSFFFGCHASESAALRPENLKAQWRRLWNP